MLGRGVTCLVAADDGQDTTTGDVEIDDIPSTENSIMGGQVIVADNAMSEDRTGATRLVGCVVVSSAEGSILTGMGEKIVSMFGGFLKNFVVFPMKVCFGKQDDVSRNRVHLVKT